MINMPISSNLKSIRSQKGVTQGQLAKMAGIELAQVSRIERGTTQPKLETIKRLALALKCSADELIFDEAEQATNEKVARLVRAIENLPEPKQLIAIEFLEALIMKCEAENWINKQNM